MKKNIKKALLVCVVICIVAMLLPSCAKKGETLMSLDGSTLSVNTYSLLLSRMKGTLKYYGYSVEDDSFFRQIISSDGETLDSYFSDEIFEKAKIYLIADYLFDKHGLMQGIAAIVAFPMGYACMKPWLEQYVVQTEISWWIYVGIFLMVALLVALCVGWRVWKTAKARPADEIK